MLKFIKLTAMGVCLALVALFWSAAGTRPTFDGGESYTFYCGSSSSEANIVTCKAELAPLYKYYLGGEVMGESTVYTSGKSAEEIIASYHARVLWEERVDGVTSYYCYAHDLPQSIDLGGRRVNLHIAVGGDRTAVGTPLIFGGF